MAWQLSKFDEWTGWCLLVSLAAYDLCAVLTPCGPLKALVNLMQQQDAPPMPG
jgi:presenilin 1